MRSELILDEEGLKIALRFYLNGMRSGTVDDYNIRPISPRNITRVEIQPRVRKVKIIFEYDEAPNGNP